AYLLGDLNLDGLHTLQDAALFRQQFDAANGAGSFSALARVPEPASAMLIAVGAGALLVGARRLRWRRMPPAYPAVPARRLLAARAARRATADTTLFSENFDALPLGPNVTESLANPTAWTQTPPAGWVINDSGVPTVGIPSRGMKEWEGWSFANKSWWV